MMPKDEHSRQEGPNKHNENPFIAFRRYADERVSSFLQGVIGLPSALSSHSSNNRWFPYDQEMRRRGSCDRDPPFRSEAEKACPRELDDKEAVEIPVKRYNRNSEIESNVSEGIRCPYKPIDQDPPVLPKDRSFGQPSDDWEKSFDFIFPSRTDLFTDSTSPSSMISGPLSSTRLLGAWPIGYIITSPYSPLYLEEQQLMRKHGVKWRHAFEDLVAIQSGRPMVKNSNRRIQKNNTEWVTFILDQWLFGPMRHVTTRESCLNGVAQEEASRKLQIPRDLEFNPNSTAQLWSLIQEAERARQQPDYNSRLPDEVNARHPEIDAEEEEFTELDLYERFLGSQGQFSSTTASEASPSPRSTPKAADTEGPLSIISTLTTTERKTLPDGTVHTKVMLKKRFADGREESSETIHTTQGGFEQKARLSQATPKEGSSTDGDAEGEKAKVKEKPRKGWFWS